MLDPQAQVERRKRLSWGSKLDNELLKDLANMLRNENPFVQTVMKAAEHDDPSYVMFLAATSEHSKDRRRYNRPTANELAIFIPEEDARRQRRPRDLYVRIRGRVPMLMTISDLHPYADPLHFVFLFPRGDYGWCPGIEAGTARASTRPSRAVTREDLQVRPRSRRAEVTLREYVVFYMMERDPKENCYLQQFDDLYQEWIVLQWAKVEQQKLNFLRHHQSTIRADLYQDVVTQATRGSTQATQVGRRIVLPSSYVGGPRYMSQLYHDGMAIVRKLGKADLFITFTAIWVLFEKVFAPQEIKINFAIL